MSNLIPLEKIENKILLMRGMKVMLDRDLAELYGVETRILNQTVKRNKKRFPDDFMFQLTRMEAEYLASEGYLGGALRSQFVTLKKEKANNKEKTGNLISQIVISRWGGTKKLPYVFTEQGVAMLSTVLNSEKAILVNIAIMRTFVNIRKFILTYEGLAMKIAELEKKYDKKISKIFEILNKLTNPENKQRPEIGFKG